MWNAPKWARVTGALGSLAELSRAWGRIPALIAIFPVEPSESVQFYALDDVHQRVGEAASRAGLAVLDLKDAFACEAGDGPVGAVFADVVHPGTRGYRVAALALLEWHYAAGQLGRDFPIDEVREIEGGCGLLRAPARIGDVGGEGTREATKVRGRGRRDGARNWRAPTDPAMGSEMMRPETEYDVPSAPANPLQPPRPISSSC